MTRSGLNGVTRIVDGMVIGGEFSYRLPSKTAYSSVSFEVEQTLCLREDDNNFNTESCLQVKRP